MSEEQTTVPEAVQSEPTTEQPQSFVSTLPEELQNEPSLKKF